MDFNRHRYETAGAHFGVAVVLHARGELAEGQAHLVLARGTYTELKLPEANAIALPDGPESEHGCPTAPAKEHVD